MKSTLTAQELAGAIERLGMVQDDFAKAVGVRGASVSRWLAGKVPIPGYVEKWLQAAHPKIYAEIKDGT